MLLRKIKQTNGPQKFESWDEGWGAVLPSPSMNTLSLHCALLSRVGALTQGCYQKDTFAPLPWDPLLDSPFPIPYSTPPACVLARAARYSLWRPQPSCLYFYWYSTDKSYPRMHSGRQTSLSAFGTVLLESRHCRRKNYCTNFSFFLRLICILLAQGKDYPGSVLDLGSDLLAKLTSALQGRPRTWRQWYVGD